MVHLALGFLFGAVGSEDLSVADFEDALSLLQLSTRRASEHSVEEELSEYENDMIAVPGPGTAGWPTWPIQPKPAWGPDGTWATPYCKDIRGCTPYCPNGCDGAAHWLAYTFPNARFGIKGAMAGSRPMDQRHFAKCHPGKKLPGSIGSSGATGWVNCLGSENATKPYLWSEASDKWTKDPLRGTGRWANKKVPTLRKHEEAYSMTPYGYEYCPIGCVNDCAYFKYGNLHQCGTTSAGWNGYDGKSSPSVGSNKRCNVDHVTYWNAVQTAVWCGEPTTTTTTTPPPPPPPAPEPEEPPAAEPQEVGDDADAVGDPHLRTNSNQFYDMESGSD